MPKATGVEQHNKAKAVLSLGANFVHGASKSRAPFFGMNISLGEKVKAVQAGMPDGNSGYPLCREN